MSAKSRNIIVTSGTSQIESDLAFRKFAIKDEDIKMIKNGPSRVADDTIAQLAGAIFGDQRIQRFFQSIYERLRASWSELPERVHKDERRRTGNFFGAELSSLVLMQKEYESVLGRHSFEEASDRLTVLYSDTLLGVFCAALLCKLASEQWRMGTVDWAFKPKDPQPDPPPRVRAIRVPGLSEEVEDPKAMDNALIDGLCDAMQPRLPVCDDAIVFTGGFKFVIPILTAFAIAHGINLYYRYEKVYDIRITRIPWDYSEAIRNAAKPVSAAPAQDNSIQRAMSTPIDPPGQVLDRPPFPTGPTI